MLEWKSGDLVNYPKEDVLDALDALHNTFIVNFIVYFYIWFLISSIKMDGF